MAADKDQDPEVVLRGKSESMSEPRPLLDDAWPLHRTAVWPESLSLRREDLYEESVEELIRP